MVAAEESPLDEWRIGDHWRKGTQNHRFPFYDWIWRLKSWFVSDGEEIKIEKVDESEWDDELGLAL